jgi:hypothetical protein
VHAILSGGRGAGGVSDSLYWMSSVNPVEVMHKPYVG